jgi:hypothetical protein
MGDSAASLNPIRETCTLDDVPSLNLRKSEIELQMQAVLIGIRDVRGLSLLATTSARSNFPDV